MLEAFNWGLFSQPAPFGNVTYFDWLLTGIKLTVLLSICSWIVAFIIGSLVGVMRTLPNRFFSTLAICYIELFRNIPLIVQFFIWYLAAPMLLPEPIYSWYLGDLDPHVQIFITSVSCLGFFTAARIAEQVRTGIDSLPYGQKNAALTLGLTLPQSYRYVLLPNAYRVIIPPLTSEMTNLIKNSSVASTIGLLELMAQGNRLVDFSAYTVESYVGVTLSYILINLILIQIMRVVEAKTRLPGNLGG